jgi:hypothetical protein
MAPTQRSGVGTWELFCIGGEEGLRGQGVVWPPQAPLSRPLPLRGRASHISAVVYLAGSQTYVAPLVLRRSGANTAGSLTQ